MSLCMCQCYGLVLPTEPIDMKLGVKIPWDTGVAQAVVTNFKYKNTQDY